MELLPLIGEMDVDTILTTARQLEAKNDRPALPFSLWDGKTLSGRCQRGVRLAG